jgi:Domain of unknown function (DUF4440)
MKKIILALATLAAMPIFMSHGVAKADGSYDYMNNCPPQDFDKCWAAYKASSTSGWKEIESNYRSTLAGCSRRDIDACLAHVSPSIMVHGSNGQVYDLARYRQSVRKNWQKAGEYRESAYIVSQDVGKDYAIVTGIEYVDYTIPRSNNPAPLRAESNFTQTWKRTSNGWKLIAITYQNQKAYARGQVPGVPAIAPVGGFNSGNVGGGAANMIREAGNGLGTVR